MKVYCCQIDIAWEEKRKNYETVQCLLEKQSIPPGSLIVLPEMFSTGFSMNVAGIHEEVPSETESFLAALARQYQSTVLGGLVTRAADGRGKNEAVVFGSNGEILVRYAKIHPFSFGGEPKHYAAGERIVQFPCGGFNVVPFVCYDLRFPEIFRVAVLQGSQVFTVIANWPSARVEHWITLLRARAIENQSYVVGVNRVGKDPKLAYPGRSLVISPRGEVLADGGDQEKIVQADLDLDQLVTWRKEFPGLQDLRKSYYNV